MRIAAHVDLNAGGDMAEVGGMERLNLGVLGHRQVIGVVTLDGVVEERKPQQQDGDEDDEAVRQRAYCSRSPTRPRRNAVRLSGQRTETRRDLAPTDLSLIVPSRSLESREA